MSLSRITLVVQFLYQTSINRTDNSKRDIRFGTH